MSMIDIRPLPLGRSTFATLRAEGAIYVDKTEMIFNLCRYGSKVFLSRPRRFGKSLLVSTFESLFKNGLRDFAGLAIEKLWTDKTYNVVRLDFSEIQDFKSIEDFEYQFLSYVAGAFQDAAGYGGDRDLIELSRWLSKQPSNSIVLLVDEYDAPLAACLDQPNVFASVQRLMNQFFLKLKAQEGCLRFFFMTGVTKFANTGIFSGFNNIDDISLSSTYGTLLGYTEDEIRQCFAGYITRAAQALHCSEAEVMSELQAHYNGFCFDRKAATRVYCPWSVLKFFNAPDQGYINYWYKSGAKPSALMHYLRVHALETPSRYNEMRGMSLDDLDTSLALPELTLDMLLVQSGYLTIKKLLIPDYVEIGYPNQEVAMSMAQLYADELLRDANRIAIGVTAIRTALAEGSLDEVVNLFNRVFNAIDYQNYPIENEAACRAIFQVLLIGAAMMPNVEVHSALGRSDLEVDAQKRRWVFEIKYARTDAEASKLLAEGLTQTEARRYGETVNVLSEEKLVRAVLVFSGHQRRFVQWALC